ncbi:hypothetical protein [Mesorhizobium sp. ANAO-SY3R2]|uniref:hypothetical protein n=1 Tax=Mesorhizobium sp. ANAO-SY3R2 TaxID=3166644 RepID=UPI003671E162
MSLWEWFSTGKGELLQAGFLGSVVAAVMEWNGVIPALRKIIVGTICALHLSPVALPLLAWALGNLQVPQENAAGLSGFLMGVTGIIVIEIILKAFRLRRDDMRRSSE